MHAAPKAHYVIFLQDDVMLAPAFVQKLDAFLSSKNRTDVVTLYTANENKGHPVLVKDPYKFIFGAVGLAIHASMVHEFAQYCRDRFEQAPLDWLLYDFVLERQKELWIYFPNLVQHVGHTSSLKGKTSPFASASFKDKGCWVAGTTRPN